MSELFLRTLRDDPADAEVPSHKLLIRAGYIRPVGPGLYSWLPLGLRVLRAWPRTCRRAGDALLAVARRHPHAVMHVMRTGAAPADQRLLAESEASERAAVRFLAAASGGVAGMIDDYLVCARPWGFAPAEVRGLVQLWHGMQDELVPVDQAMHLVAALPRVQAALHPDEGHFFYRRRLREILGDLVAATEPRVRLGPACGVRRGGR